MFSAYLPAGERRWAHGPRSSKRGMREQQRLGRDLDRSLHGVLGGMCYVADESEPMARTHHLRAKRSKPMMGNRAGLVISDVVGGVVYKLDMPDTSLVRFLKPLQFPLEEIQSLNVAYDRRIARRMCGFQVRCRERTAQAVVSRHLIHPVKTVQMV